MREAWLALMGAAQQCYRDAGGHENDDNPADPYMTLLGYFNSLRELGGAGASSRTRSRTRSSSYGSAASASARAEGLFGDRKIVYEVVELTSRVPTDKVAEAQAAAGAAVPRATTASTCAIATNMISVGLDITRLGLMVVLGQPKTTAEYIQATSRVGRDDERARARGHAPERPQAARPLALRALRHYHESFYRTVEATSVTPFSPRALDRGLAGTLVALARHARARADAADGRASRSSTCAPSSSVGARRVPRARARSSRSRRGRARGAAARACRTASSTCSTRGARSPTTTRRPASQLQYQQYELDAAQAAAARDARHGLRVRAPPEVPRQPLAARRGAEVNLWLKDLSGVDGGGRRMSRQGARPGPPQPGDHDLRARRAARPAEPLGDRRRPGDLAEGRATSRRSTSRGWRASSQLITGVAAPAALRAAAGLERSRASRSGASAPGSSRVVHRAGGSGGDGSGRARAGSSTARRSTSKGRFDGTTGRRRPASSAPARRGHVGDLDWYGFVHRGRATTAGGSSGSTSAAPSGDLGDLVVRCECGKQRAAARGGRARDERARARATARGPGSGTARSEELRRAEPPADPHGRERLLPAGHERHLAARPQRARSRSGRAELWEDLQFVEDAGGARRS